MLRIAMAAMMLLAPGFHESGRVAAWDRARWVVPEGLGWFVRVVPISVSRVRVAQVIAVIAAGHALIGLRTHIALAALRREPVRPSMGDRRSRGFRRAKIVDTKVNNLDTTTTTWQSKHLVPPPAPRRTMNNTRSALPLFCVSLAMSGCSEADSGSAARDDAATGATVDGAAAADTLVGNDATLGDGSDGEAGAPSSVGADGWAAFHRAGDTSVTNGGAAADKAHVYTVTNRRELILALYPDAVIAADGSFYTTADLDLFLNRPPFVASASGANGDAGSADASSSVQPSDASTAGDVITSDARDAAGDSRSDSTAGDAGARGITPDPTPKIIYVKGHINLSVNGQNAELGFDDYKDPGFDFSAYVAAYAPSTWNKTLDAVTNKPPKLYGPLEDARKLSSMRQENRVLIPVGANTSIIGLGADATISKGNLLIAENADNVVIRNITFEDAYDYFPAWDPTDSFVLNTTVAGCQRTYVDASTGPQKCLGGRWNSNYDSITVNGGTHVWIDHCTFTDGTREDTSPANASVFPAPHIGLDFIIEHHDGEIDVVGKSDFVTLSYNHFTNHDKTNLLGNTDTATEANGFGHLSISVHHNHYENCGQRLPRVRMGKVHVYNNYYEGQVLPVDSSKPAPANRFLYGLGIGYLAKIYSENNAFELSAAAGEAAPGESFMYFLWHKAAPTTGSGLDVNQKTYFFDSGSMLNGTARDVLASAQAAALAQGKPALVSTDTVWIPSQSYAYQAIPAAAVKAAVTPSAGAGKL